MFFFLEFVADDHSQLLIGFISTVWFSLRLVSGVKRFEDMQDCSVAIADTVGIFFFLLKLCTTGIHLPPAAATSE